jgi:hypothetical protein
MYAGSIFPKTAVNETSIFAVFSSELEGREESKVKYHLFSLITALQIADNTGYL